MKISEKQLMKLLILMSQLNESIEAPCRLEILQNISHEIMKTVTEIYEQQSDELREIE